MSFKGTLLKKDWVHNKTRNCLSALSILLGVAVLIATVITVPSTKNAFLQMVNGQSSGANLLATALSDQRIKTAAFTAHIAGIDDAFPFYSEDGYFNNGGTYHSLTAMAVDFANERKYGGYKLLGGALPRKGECLIPEAMKAAYHIKQGDKIAVRTDSKTESLKISGFVADTGIASTNMGKCILTDYKSTSGYGAIVYKLMLKQGADIKAEKAAIQKALKGKYTIDYPSGQTEQILKEADLLFGTMMGFGFLTLLLGGFLIFITVNEYVRKMRQKISTIKVLGAVRADIMKLVLGKSLMIGLPGVLLGGAAGVFGSRLLIHLVDRLFTGGLNFQPVVHVSFIAAIVFGAVLFSLLISLPAALHAANETISDGFHQYNKTSAISIRRIVVSAGLFALFIIARLLTGQWLFTFAAVVAGIYLFALIAFIPCVKLVLMLINHSSPFNGFTVKNNFVKQKRKAINLAVLFSFVIAISVGIILVVNEISDSTMRMEKGEYFGDAVASTVTGQGLNTNILDKIKAANGVEKAYPIDQKYVNIGDDNVQAKGFCLDNTNIARLGNNWLIPKFSLQKLKGSNTILLSEKVLRDQKLRIGDTIFIGSGTERKSMKIIGTYSTMNNDGNSAILSQQNFLSSFQNYTIRAVNVFSKSGVKLETLKANIARSVKDSFIQTDSALAIQKAEAKQSDQFIMLINCMIVILVAASILMLINSISMNIKNNQYTLSVIKLLGATGRNLVLQSIIEGLIYGLFSAVVGIFSGIILNSILTASMNRMTAWNLQTTIPASIVSLCGIGFLCAVLLAEIIATALNYKSNDKSVLVQE